MAYLEEHIEAGHGGGNMEVTKSYSEWTKAQLQSALDDAGVAYQKKLKRPELLDLYKAYIEDERTDTDEDESVVADEGVVIAESDSDSSDTRSDTDDSVAVAHSIPTNYFATDRLRRQIVNEPKLSYSYPCSCGCEASYYGADMMKCAECKLVYVRTICNERRTCFECRAKNVKT